MRFWTADLHLGHANILKYCNRPWDSVEEMNEGLIERWNAVVGPDDEVMVLGDVVMGHAAETLKLIARLNGSKTLIAGNHDRLWAGSGRAAYVERWTAAYKDAGFEVLSHGEPQAVMLSDGRLVVASHFPYEPDERHGTVFNRWHPQDIGWWLLHGHVHDSWKVRGRQINVGVDVNDYQPVPEAQVLDIIAEAEARQDGVTHVI